ncbi:MAG: UbiA family prenyltransferase [Candidatus Saccharimonas sp.]
MEIISAIWRISRPYNSLIPLLLLYIGATLVGASDWMIVVGMVILFVLHSVATIANDVEDMAIDKANKRDVSVISSITKRQAWWILGLITVATIIVSAVFLNLLFTFMLLYLLVLSGAYNMRPQQLSRRPISSIVVLGICYGMLPLLMGASLGTLMPFNAILLSVFLAISRTSLSMLKDYKDASGDAAHHKRTFLLVYGRTRVRQVSVALAAIGYAGTIIMSGLLLGGQFWPWGVVSIALALWLLVERLRLSPTKSYRVLNVQFHRSLQFEALFYGAIAIWATTSLI